MPELPEVQTIVDDLNRKIIGRKITGVWFDSAKLIKSPKADDLASQIKGLKIDKVSRRGKNILIYLKEESRKTKRKAVFLLLIHQKMTGHLLYGKWLVEKINRSKFAVKSLIKGPLQEKVNDYIHLIFYLDSGWQVGLSDLRKFAKILFGRREKVENSPDLKKLGPEPLDEKFKFLNFASLIKPERRKIKQVLMDQEVVAGIGNIYADEILWEAKINPFKPADRLEAREFKNLYKAIREILKKAIKLRGTSISDYRDTGGESGRYGEIRKVYRRSGESCKRCGTAIKRVKIGGRSAHYCPVCQSF